VDLFEIMNHAEHQPLGIDLDFATERELFEADTVTDIGKGILALF
jgi:hypothetical protein